ncbi:hypothetical protein OG978_32770 [Streptomyces sp. NBC_01591]|uniref:hypothetical protein n=1 Tax=Streptomyces sp. NBC_01591 TaxID=2975888 RepID=UPI002DDC0AE1|nr:hypothetical protein [Streptomyces sp. NBC_01591]WSD71748.1 hypothetical protein OG978_32770 [Streptomyces sp. NBC_01591]
MNDVIRIQPTRGRRIDFARWAVVQRPKVDTVGVHEFGVPARLFAGMPESILIGSIVDGHRYVSPEEDATLGRPGPGASGPAVPTVATVVGESGPETIIPLTRPDRSRQLAKISGLEQLLGTAVPEPSSGAATPDSDRSDSTSNKADGGGENSCDVCQRTFTTPRGRDAHRRQVHPEA